MKKTVSILAFSILALASCQQQQKEAVSTEQVPVVATPTPVADSLQFGAPIDASKAVMMVALQDQVTGKDSIADCTVRGKVVEVCQKKGCWMTIEREGKEPVRVTFKDYALFMPKDLAGKEVVIHGVAKTETVSVEDLRHYAQDAGKTAKEIKAINKPETELSFEADGVAIQK